MKGVGKTKSRSRKPQERKGRTVFAEQFCEAKTAQGFLSEKGNKPNESVKRCGQGTEANTGESEGEAPCTSERGQSADDRISVRREGGPGEDGTE